MKKASFPSIICSPKQKERRHQKGAEKYTSKTEKTPEHHSHRWKIIWIPAKLVKRGRSFKLKLADWWTYQRQFQRA
jgi:hypothetical protein